MIAKVKSVKVTKKSKEEKVTIKAKVIDTSVDDNETFAFSEEAINYDERDHPVGQHNLLVLYLTCNEIAFKTSQEIGAQLVAFSNNALQDNLELSKDFFSCSTFVDMIGFQEKSFNASWENIMDHTDRLSGTFSIAGNKLEEAVQKNLNATLNFFAKHLV